MRHATRNVCTISLSFARRLPALLCASFTCISVHAAPPAFTGVPERIDVNIGEAFSIPLAVTDADGDTVLVTVDGLPAWMRAAYDEPALNTVDTIVLPASVSFVWDMDSDAAGNVYFSGSHATEGGQILKLDAHGTLSVLATNLGNATNIAVTPDGHIYYAIEEGLLDNLPFRAPIFRLGSNGAGVLLNESIDRVFEMDADPSGNLIILRVNGSGTVTQVIKLTPADGIARVLAGSEVPQASEFPNQHEQVVRDGSGRDARFAFSQGLFVGKDGNAFVPDIAGRIRKVTPAGEVTTLPFSVSSLTRAIMADASGRAFQLWDSGIVHVDATGTSRVIAGDLGDPQSRDGWGTAARFRTIIASTMRSDGSIVLADWQTQEEPWRPLLRTVKFNARGLSGVPDPDARGMWDLTLTASDGRNTVTRKLTVAVANDLDLSGATQLDPRLPPGGTVSGGSLGGTIVGDAVNPPTLRALTVLPNSTLRDVIVGADVELGAGLRLLGNVRFERGAVLPPDVSLDAAFGYLPGSGSPDGIYPGNVDLDGSIRVDGTTLLDDIRAATPELGRAGALRFIDGRQLAYAQDDVKASFEVIRVTSATRTSAGGYTSGISFDATGRRYVDTPSGYRVFLRPAMEDTGALALALFTRNYGVSHDFDGVHMAGRFPTFRPFEFAVLPDPVSRPAQAGLTPGFHLRPHPEFPGYSYYLFVFASGAQLREQALYPTAMSPGILDDVLNLSRDGDVTLLPTGGVELNFRGARLRLMPSLTTTPGTDTAFGFRAAGDLNGDGLEDYRMTYPRGLALGDQIYYGLP